MRVSMTVNGEQRSADDVWPGESLLYVLRERLGLPGSKNACEQGECGSCTVYLDGTAVCACLVAAGQAEGRQVLTVEGLSGPPPDTGERGRPSAQPLQPGTPASRSDGRGGGELDPVQRAFLAAGAVQCGFCTPGLVVAAHDLLRRTPRPSDMEIREALAGNLCRCTGYEMILDAVRAAAAELAR
jgi:carbon-monoxide dehydrogenase small subunit